MSDEGKGVKGAMRKKEQRKGRGDEEGATRRKGDEEEGAMRKEH